MKEGDLAWPGRSDRKREVRRREKLRQNRGRRIEKLIEKGIISDEAEIPPEAIPVDPDKSTLAGLGVRRFFMRILSFSVSIAGRRNAGRRNHSSYTSR